MAQVQQVRYCPWCRETKPDHECPAGAVGCTTNPPEGRACGTCTSCQQAQLDDYAFRYGTPSELDTPWRDA